MNTFANMWQKNIEILPVIQDTDTYYTLVSSCGLEVSYSLSQLKRSGLGIRELVQFFCTCIRPITQSVFRSARRA